MKSDRELTDAYENNDVREWKMDNKPLASEEKILTEPKGPSVFKIKISSNINLQE